MLDSFASSTAMDRSAAASPEPVSLNSHSLLEEPGRQRPMLDGMVADNGKHIEWMRDLNQAMKAAAEQHKPLVVIFEEDNCGWCKQFDKELTKPAAMQLGGDAIFIKIHPSRDVDGQALASNLGITGYPTVSILDFNGTNVSERSRTTGFISADQLAAQFGSGPSASNIQMA